MVRTRNAAWLMVLGAGALVALALSPLHAAGDLEARMAALIAPVTGALARAVQPGADVLLHAGQVEQLTNENAALREQVAQLEAEASTLRDQQASSEQATALQAAVGAGAGYLAASVTVRDPAPGRRGIVIDRGSLDGVVVGQAVLGPGATLVGVVAEAQPHAARVRLVDDVRSAVAAVVQQSRTPGALAGGTSGASGTPALRLDFVPIGSQVHTGDLVVTSPLGGKLPAGLLIGRVGSVESKPEELFESIRIEPYTDYNRLLQVLVLTSSGDAK